MTKDSSISTENQPHTADPEATSFVGLVDSLSDRVLASWKSCQCMQLPSRAAVLKSVDQLRTVIFPGYFEDLNLTRTTLHFHIGRTLDATRTILLEQIRRGLCFVHHEKLSHGECDRMGEEIVDKFLAALPRIRDLLMTDVQAAFDGDPAALSPDETIYCYPGVRAITNYRIAHELYRLDVPILPRIITEHAHSRTGVDIHPGAQIGHHFFIDHGTGVVIGQTAILGNYVRIYQGVTLGARSFPKDARGLPVKGIPRHPILQDRVIVYAGATVLGRVTIGEGAIIGGNVWLTESVPPLARITQQSYIENDLVRPGEGI